MRNPVRKLDADTYWTLYLGALAFGGIGAGDYDVESPEGGEEPYCAHGCVQRGKLVESAWLSPFVETRNTDGNRKLFAAGITETENDDAVERINQRIGKSRIARVPFAAWCKELNVVCKESS